ncbi:MAG TPA: hypothetical protein VF042_11010 [Gemmatimonadaceae bacterium]
MMVTRVVAGLLLFPVSLIAQTSSQTDSATAAAASSIPQFDFSGILYANYQYRGDAGPNKSANKFDIERVYLTFRVPAGDRLSVRVTTDVFQQTASGNDSYYRGWTVRAKYAYLQYNYLSGPGWQSSARIGLLQTVFIEHDEQFWPRWISPSPTDRAGYFSSADAGIGNTVTLPRKLGQIYSTVTNGPGYTSRETDRFKDFATRVTITPWAKNKSSQLAGVALSAWAYKGATASRFVEGGAGQAGRIGSALDRDRWGVHIGNLHPRFTFGAEYATRREEGELGNNTAASPREVTDSTGTLWSVYGVVRPLKSTTAAPHPLSLIARYDRVTTNANNDNRYDVLISGVSWDLSNKVSAAVDYQATEPKRGNTVARTHTWFAHFVARF